MSDQLTELIPLSDADRRKLEKLFRPINDVVVVAVDEQEEKSPGGIILLVADNENMTPRSGTVIAAGPGSYNPVAGERVPLSTRVGDRVIFGQYAGTELKYGSITLKAMREVDILTIVIDDDALQPDSVRVRRQESE